MNRRQFVQAALVPLLLTQRDDVDELKKVFITRITGFPHKAHRPRVAGKNSQKDVHGEFTSENILRIETNAGIEGIGIGTVQQALARDLIGHSLDEFWKKGIGIVSPLGRADHALYDLVGKALDMPTWKVLGGVGPEWVPVYDGSIYFNDLLPEFQSRGVAHILEGVEASLKAGHRAFKIKVGRGAKWMEPKAGLARDIEVCRAIRKLVGNEARLMVDANNAFDLESAEVWLDAAGDDFYFVEELFPEQIDRDLLLKKYLTERGRKTLIADGESADDIDDLVGLIDHEALDVFQPDIRRFGLTRQCALARKMALHPRLKLAPHNWGSFLGLYMQLTLARGVPNFLMAEQDPSTSDLFDTSAFEFRNGKIRVPDVIPGCAITIRQDVYEKKYAANAWSVE